MPSGTFASRLPPSLLRSFGRRESRPPRQKKKGRIAAGVQAGMPSDAFSSRLPPSLLRSFGGRESRLPRRKRARSAGGCRPACRAARSRAGCHLRCFAASVAEKAGPHDRKGNAGREGPRRNCRTLLIRPVEPHRVVHEQPPLLLRCARDIRNEVHQQPVVRHMVLQVRMRPVGPPEHAVRERLD
jgi:hypothetical protein